ncbi:MAG TPA: iron ABC transporter permease [Phycisphaerales bacterium]|nr:iron ABC transporter permease [Phycisphaerales bacterium]
MHAGPPLSRHLARLTSGYALWSILTAILLILLVYPIILTVRGALTERAADGSDHYTFKFVSIALSDPGIRECLFNSVKMAITTTTLCTLIAVPLAILSAKYLYPLKGVFNALILVPLILPPFVGAIGMSALLGREGAINAVLGHLGIGMIDFLGHGKFWGCVAVDSLHLYPIIYLNAAAALANLDPALEEAADNLGCGPWKKLFTITLPLIRPGVFAGATIVFIWELTELGTPVIFDYTRVMSVQVFNKLHEVESSPEPYALVIIMLVMAIALYAIGKYLLAGRAYAMYSKASRAASETRLAGAKAWLATAAFVLVTCCALLPHIGVVLTALSSPGQWYHSVLPRSMTLHNFQEALSHPDAFNSIVNSLKVSTAAVLMAAIFGLLASYVIVRTPIRGRHVLDALCMLPLAVPGIVIAFGYVAMTLKWPFKAWSGGGDGPLGSIQVLGNTPSPLILIAVAYAVRRMPYIVRAAVSGLEQTSGELEEAAMNLGATRFTAVRKVIMPLITANIVAGCLLAFSFAMLAVSEPLLMAQQQSQFPITKAIYSFANRLADGPFIASAMGVWGMMLLAVTLVGASILLGKKMGSIFRV